MKLVMTIALLFVGANAHAEVEFKRPANDASACTTPVQKEFVRQYISGKLKTPPSCYKLGSIRATIPSVNNCTTAYQKVLLTRYLKGKDRKPPSCYQPNKWIGHTKSWANCSFQDRLKVRQIQNGKADVSQKYPACYN